MIKCYIDEILSTSNFMLKLTSAANILEISFRTGIFSKGVWLDWTSRLCLIIMSLTVEISSSCFFFLVFLWRVVVVLLRVFVKDFKVFGECRFLLVKEVLLTSLQVLSRHWMVLLLIEKIKRILSSTEVHSAIIKYCDDKLSSNLKEKYFFLT